MTFIFPLILKFGIQRRLKTSSYNDDVHRENKNTKKEKREIFVKWMMKVMIRL